MGPRLEAHVEEKGNLRLLKIDIEHWGSPVAEQFGIRRLPTIWLYDGSKRISDDAAEIEKILRGK